MSSLYQLWFDSSISSTSHQMIKFVLNVYVYTPSHILYQFEVEVEVEVVYLSYLAFLTDKCVIMMSMSNVQVYLLPREEARHNHLYL